MGLISPTIPTLGNPNATEDPNVRSSLITIRDVINGNLDNANISSGAGIDGSKLADGSVTAAKLSGGSAVNNTARVYNSADISLPSGATNVLTFNSERWDSNSLHSTSSNTSRLTVPSAGSGVYVMFGTVLFSQEGTSAGQLVLNIRLNGTTNILGNSESLGVFSGGNIQVGGLYKLAASDYIELIAYQDSGVTRKAVASVNTSPEFGMAYISAG